MIERISAISIQNKISKDCINDTYSVIARFIIVVNNLRYCLTKQEINYEGVGFEGSSFTWAFFEAIKFLSL